MEIQGEADNIDDDMEPEKYGIERIIEALHTHTWPNRVLKGIECFTINGCLQSQRVSHMSQMLCFTGLTNGRISTSTEPDVSQIEDQLDSIRLSTQRSNTDHLMMESLLGISWKNQTQNLIIYK